MLIRLNPALKRIDHPDASHHLTVTVDRGLAQLSGSPELELLDEALEHLTDALSSVAVEVGRVTERGRRTTHFVTADPDRALEIARGWARRNPQFGPQAESVLDERWAFRDLFEL